MGLGGQVEQVADEAPLDGRERLRGEPLLRAGELRGEGREHRDPDAGVRVEERLQVGVPELAQHGRAHRGRRVPGRRAREE